MLVATCSLVAICVLTLWVAGVVNTLERQSVDERFSWRGSQSPGDSIVIVGVDQTTLQELAVRPPLPRSSYAQVLDRVKAGSPRTVLVDVQFIGRTTAEQDQALISAVARNGPVLLATHDGPDGPIVVPADVPDAPGAVSASAAIERDPDGVLRRMIYAPVEMKTLAVRAAEMFSGQEIELAELDGNHAWVDFRGPPRTFEQYPFSDVLEGRVPADAFTDKAVLIGFTDPAGSDVFVTSASATPMPGIEVHANAMWTALNDFPLQSASGLVDVVLIITLIAIPAAIGARRSGLFTLVGSLVSVGVFLVCAQLAFNAGWIVAVVCPVIGAVLSTAATIGVDAYVVRKQRAALEATLGDLLLPQKPAAFFISYRRSQNTWQARDIRRELVRRYGEESVFMDTSSIEYGEAFPDQIARVIRGCSVVLVLIGPLWLESTGVRRIDDPEDWVRREVEAGLHRQDAAVVPVLLDNAVMPTEEQLPDSIKGLASLHAVHIAGEDLSSEIDQLLESVERGQRRLVLGRPSGDST